MMFAFLLFSQSSLAVGTPNVSFSDVTPIEVGSYKDINQNADKILRASVMVYEDGTADVHEDCMYDPEKRRPEALSLFQVHYFKSTSPVPYVVRTQRVGDALWIINGDTLWTSIDGQSFEKAPVQWTMKQEAVDEKAPPNIHSLGALFREEIWVDGKNVLLNNPLRLSKDGGKSFQTVSGSRVKKPLRPYRTSKCDSIRPQSLLSVEDQYPDAEGFLGVKPEETYCFGLHKTAEGKWRIFCLDVVESVQHDPGSHNVTRYTVHEADTWEDFLERWEDTRLEEKEQFFAGGRLARCQFKNASVMFSYPDGSGCQRETAMPSWSAIGFYQTYDVYKNSECYNGHAPPYLTTQRMSRTTTPRIGDGDWCDRAWLCAYVYEKDPFGHRQECLSHFQWMKEKIVDRSLKATGQEYFYKALPLIGGIRADNHIILLESWIKGSRDPKDRVFSFFDHSSGDKYFLTSNGLRSLNGDPTDPSGPRAKMKTVHHGIRKDCISSKLHMIEGVPTRVLACEGGEIWICPNDDCKKAYSLSLSPPFEVTGRRFQIFDTEWFKGHLYFGTSFGLIRAGLKKGA